MILKFRFTLADWSLPLAVRWGTYHMTNFIDEGFFSLQLLCFHLTIDWE